MKSNKTLLAAGVVTAVVGASAVGLNSASAHPGDNGEARQSFISSLAERFSLDQTEVETFLDEKQDERKAQKQEAKQEHIAGLIEDGTLTQEQADALETKYEELREQKESLRDQDLTREEMRALMMDAKEDLENWTEEQGIDLDSIRPDKGTFKGRRGHHKMMHDRYEDVDSAENEGSEEDVSTTVQEL